METAAVARLGSDPASFRRALGQFASGVTVITTPTDDTVHGMTANAFMSGSLEPPLVIISIGHRARLRLLIETSGVFGVSVLSSDQEAHSRHFSGRAQQNLSPKFRTIGGVPVLDQALTVITASVRAAHACGDHTLFVGGVHHMEIRDGAPLLFFNGTYRSLAG